MMCLLIAIIAIASFRPGVDSQSLGPVGPCVGQLCMTGFFCVAGYCYNASNACLPVNGALMCPGQALCVPTGIGNQTACILPPVAATPVPTIVPVTTPIPCVDKNGPNGQPSNCPSVAYLCNNPLYYDLMTEQCPKTCGRCPGSSTGTCVDKNGPNGQPSNCPSVAHLCNNPLYYDLMTQQCPKTCNRCSGSSVVPPVNCVDQPGMNGAPSNCAQVANLCNNPLYYNLMTQQCPKTCGRC